MSEEREYRNSLKNMKALVSKFQEETKSNSVLDFITWFDCTIEMGIKNIKK